MASGPMNRALTAKTVRAVGGTAVAALVVNELATNALKYAFPRGRRGSLVLSLRKREGNRCSLSVTDNGVGMSEDKGRGFGTELVYAFAQQLKGKLERGGGPDGTGTEWRLVFPIARLSESPALP